MEHKETTSINSKKIEQMREKQQLLNLKKKKVFARPRVMKEVDTRNFEVKSSNKRRGFTKTDLHDYSSYMTKSDEISIPQKQESKEVEDSVTTTLNKIHNKKIKMQKIIKDNNNRHKMTLTEDIFNDFVLFSPEYGFQLHPIKQRVDTFLLNVYNKKYQQFKNAIDKMYYIVANIDDYEVSMTPNDTASLNRLMSIIKRRSAELANADRYTRISTVDKCGRAFIAILYKEKSTGIERRFSLNESYVFLSTLTKEKTVGGAAYDITLKDTFGMRFNNKETIFRDLVLDMYYEVCTELLRTVYNTNR